jgi:broad specificity phosphatase PhoE
MTKTKKYTTFYLVRHGETEWNKKGIMQGQKDSPLTEQGIVQAQRFAEETIATLKFHAIFSSDLSRAQKTAEIFALKKKLILNTTHLLRERNYGVFQGKSYVAIKQEYRERYEIMEKLSKAEHFKYKLHPTVESDEEMILRFNSFVQETLKTHAGKRLLLVSHGGFIRTLLIHLNFAGYDELPTGALENTGYVIVESNGHEHRIKKVVGLKKKQKQNRYE